MIGSFWNSLLFSGRLLLKRPSRCALAVLALGLVSPLVNPVAVGHSDRVALERAVDGRAVGA